MFSKTITSQDLDISKSEDMSTHRQLFCADSLYVSEVSGNAVDQNWNIGPSSNKPISTLDTDSSQSDVAGIQSQFFIQTHSILLIIMTVMTRQTTTVTTSSYRQTQINTT